MANPETVALANSAHALPPGSRPVRKTDPNRWIELTVGVRRSVELPDLAAWDEIPPSQRVPLSRADVSAHHGPDPVALAAIGEWAIDHDLVVTRTDAISARMGLGGTAASLCEAFEVELLDYEHDELGEFHARTGPVRLPARLANDVTGVFGFNNHPILQPWSDPINRVAKAGPWSMPPELARIYSCPAANVPGRTIGLVQFGAAGRTADVTAYFGKLGLARPTVQVVPGDDCLSGSAARPKIVVYFSSFDEKGMVDILSTVLADSDNDPSILAISWGLAESEALTGSWAWSPAVVEHVAQSFLAAAHLGISICADTSDALAEARTERAASAAGPLWASLIARLKSMLYIEHMVGGDAAELLAAFR